jgi:hypothetical protein
MSSGGNDWLALKLESTLEPEILICDAHHHLWDLRPERIPFVMDLTGCEAQTPACKV